MTLLEAALRDRVSYEASLAKLDKSITKESSMNTKYFLALTAMVLATGLSPPLTNAQAPQLVLTSMFNEVLVQRYPKSPSLQIDAVPPPPPERGAPGGRRGGASRAAPSPVAQPKSAS
jgi:hypothetical protein